MMRLFSLNCLPCFRKGPQEVAVTGSGGSRTAETGRVAAGIDMMKDYIAEAKRANPVTSGPLGVSYGKAIDKYSFAEVQLIGQDPEISRELQTFMDRHLPKKFHQSAILARGIAGKSRSLVLLGAAGQLNAALNRQQLTQIHAKYSNPGHLGLRDADRQIVLAALDGALATSTVPTPMVDPTRLA